MSNLFPITSYTTLIEQLAGVEPWTAAQLSDLEYAHQTGPDANQAFVCPDDANVQKLHAFKLNGWQLSESAINLLQSWGFNLECGYLRDRTRMYQLLRVMNVSTPASVAAQLDGLHWG